MYDWVGVDANTGGDLLHNHGTGNPIFFLKTGYELLDSGTFWLSDTPDEPSFGPGAAIIRACTWVKLKNRLTGDV